MWLGEQLCEDIFKLALAMAIQQNLLFQPFQRSFERHHQGMKERMMKQKFISCDSAWNVHVYGMQISEDGTDTQKYSK